MASAGAQTRIFWFGGIVIRCFRVNNRPKRVRAFKQPALLLRAASGGHPWFFRTSELWLNSANPDFLDLGVPNTDFLRFWFRIIRFSLILVFSVDLHWFSVISVGFQWFPLIFIDSRWFPLVFIDFPWFPFDFYWFSLVFSDFLCFAVVFSGFYCFHWF